MPLSPDCSDRFKHAACSGDAWDDDLDQPTACTCSCHRPSTDELLGVAADWLGGQTVDEYMAQIRSGARDRP